MGTCCNHILISKIKEMILKRVHTLFMSLHVLLSECRIDLSVKTKSFQKLILED